MQQESLEPDGHPVQHLISFDIEGFIEASHDSFVVPPKYISPREEAREIEANTMVILESLQESQVTATFFTLGRIGRDMPFLLRQIADAGHEIAAHSFDHRRLHKFDAEGAFRQLRLAKEQLEQTSGKSVIGFRAPDFSIVRDNLHILTQLRELGYRYDSSVFPISFHDAYGLSAFPRVPFVLPNGLIEFPMSTAKLGGMTIPFGGGGYLRLYPLWLTCRLLREAAREGVPTVVYLHPFEMAKIVPYISELSILRRFRTYVGVRTVREKLLRLLQMFKFVSFADFLASSPLLPTIEVYSEGASNA
jgi:polysaccharide deacetylase family protein (PEP-CTERM system associated)